MFSLLLVMTRLLLGAPIIDALFRVIPFRPSANRLSRTCLTTTCSDFSVFASAIASSSQALCLVAILHKRHASRCHRGQPYQGQRAKQVCTAVHHGLPRRNIYTQARVVPQAARWSILLTRNMRFHIPSYSKKNGAR